MIWVALHLGAFAAACGLGAALTFAARAVAPRLGVVDRPAGRKDHARPTPVNGGWAIYATVMLLAGVGGFIAPALAPHLPAPFAPLVPYLQNLAGVRGKLGAILLGYTMIFLVGAVDDVRPLGPRLKLAAQALAVVPLIAAGVSIHLFLPWPPLGWTVTLLWAVALMNSFNFMDNMDGLTATVAAVIAAVLALAAAGGGSVVSPALFLVFAGALAGFLIFNWNPASIFLGDSGALSIGYLLAAFSIMPEFWRAGHQPTGLPVLIPLAVFPAHWDPKLRIPRGQVVAAASIVSPKY